MSVRTKTRKRKYKPTRIPTLSWDFFILYLFIRKFATLYLLNMADGITYGLGFPFRQSQKGDYVNLTETSGDEIRSNLIHLLLTRRGYRYYLPDFGTRLYEFIFEPLDGQTFDTIKSEIEEAVNKYIPNLTIENITIEAYIDSEPSLGELSSEQFDIPIYRVPGANTEEYTAKVKIEYTDDNNPFGSKEFVIINL